jgi:hypothetical protein
VNCGGGRVAEDQPAIEEIRNLLVAIVQEGLKARPEGVHLTYIGAEFAKRVNAPFEQYLNVLAVQQKLDVPISCRKMAPFIQRYCVDLFDLVKNPDGSVLLRSKQGLHDVEELPAAPPVYHRFKKAFFVAFIRPLREDARRFLNLDTLGFTDAKRKPPGEVWLEISRQYITETPIDEPIDGAAVQGKVADWIEDNGLESDVFIDHSHKASSADGALEDLLKIIDSLPSDVCSRWSIPAEVLRALRRNS